MIFKILIVLNCFLIFSSQDNILDITPKANMPEDTDEMYYIPIFHTNDIHSFFFPQEITASNNITYKSGGLEYMAKYLSILRKKWAPQEVLWFDSGDEFQGGLENKLSNGEIMSEFLNTMKCNAATIGNHEWDFGQKFLQDRLKAATTYKYISANLKIAEDRKALFENLLKSYIITTSTGVKIGIIGLSTVTTPETTSGNLEGITFEEYQPIVEKLVSELRNQTNVIALLLHLGLKCENTFDKLKLQARTNDTEQGKCNENDELYKLLHSLNKDLVDVVFAGHKHDVVHHWINGTPVSCNDRNGNSASVVYLPFNKSDNKLRKDKIVLEGPLPSCEKIFKNARHCNLIEKESDMTEAGDLVEYKYQGENITQEPLLKPVATKWLPLLEEYRIEKVTETDYILAIDKAKETGLGNLFCDILLRITGSTICILNPGGFRKKWSKGNVTRQDMYEISPFDNMIVTVDVTGRELIRMLTELQAGKYGYYVTSGLKQVAEETGTQSSPIRRLLSVKLFDGINESPIIQDKIYSLATLDFAIPLGGDDFKGILSWYTPRNWKKLEGEYRDHIEGYLKNIDLINVKSLIDADNPRLRIIDHKTAT